MKNVPRIFATLLTIVSAVVLSVATSNAQLVDAGYAEQLPAREFLISVPPISPYLTEFALDRPLVLYISSDVDARITVVSTSQMARQIEREVLVKAGEVLSLSVPFEFCNALKPQERFNVVHDRTIRLSSDVDVSVAWSIEYMGNSEMVNCLPMSHWGTSYRTPHTFSDEYGVGGKEKAGTAIATLYSNNDSNDIDVQTTVPLELSKDIDVVAPLHYRVRLDSGEAITLKWAYDQTTLRSWASDPSGTLITSTYPIGVVAGASKNAIMRMPNYLPPSGPFKEVGNMVRGLLAECVPPTLASGTTFVTVPLMYTSTRVEKEGNAEYGVDEMLGDVVRVIALHDSTVIERTLSGEELKVTLDTLNSGEWFVDTAASKAAFWESSKPVQLWQYGKSYTKFPPPNIKKSRDNNQAFPVVEAGMPCLTLVPDVDRWTSQARFGRISGLDHFMNIAFRTGDEDSIYINGKSLREEFEDSISKFPALGYSFLRTPVNLVEYNLKASNPDVKFCVWFYGSIDGLSIPRSYATVADVDGAVDLESDMEANGTTVCTTMSGTAANVANKHLAANIVGLEPVKLENAVQKSAVYNTSTASWSFEPVDALLPASATMRIYLSNKRVYEYNHSYSPTTFTPPTTSDSLLVNYDSAACFTIVLNNTTTDPLPIVGVKHGKNHQPTISPEEFVVPPNGEQRVTICYEVSWNQWPFPDTVEFWSDCSPASRHILYFDGARTEYRVSDVELGYFEIGAPPFDTVTTIFNDGPVVLNIDSISLASGQHFSINQSTVPLHLASGESADIGVRFVPPTEITQKNPVRDYLIVRSDGRRTEGTGELTARLKNPVSVEENLIQINLFPNPLNRDEHHAVRINLPDATNSIEIYDATGTVVATQLVGDSSQLTLKANTFGSAGLYVIVGKNETDVVFRATLVVR